MEYVLTERIQYWQKFLTGMSEWQEQLQAWGLPAEQLAERLGALSELGEQCGLPITDMLARLSGILGRGEVSHEEQAAIAQLAEKMRSYAQKEYESRLYDGPEGLLKEIRMENIFSTSFSKKALIVYILSPFYYPESESRHTNVREARAMSDTLRELGYDVDVVNSYYAGEVDAGRYDLLIGFRRPFEELLPRVRKECISVYYTTEASPYFANPAELKRILYFEERNGRRLSYERQNHACLDLERLQLADGAICIGNDWTLSTYRGMFRRCFRQNVSSTELKRDAAHKAGTPYGRAFLWYGGAGALHKGADLCIEAFRSLPELQLHIVGRLDGGVLEYYRDELDRSENVFYHGFLTPDSEEFLDVCGICDFCVAVSCSESQSTAVCTAMRGGVIPVCLPCIGIDAEEYGGFMIEDDTVQGIVEACRKLSELTADDIIGRRERVFAFAAQNHSLNAYREMLRENLEGFQRCKEGQPCL